MNSIINKIALLILLIIVCIYIYFPVFCFVKEIEVVGNSNIPSDEIVQTAELKGTLFTIINRGDAEEKLNKIKLVDKIVFEQRSIRKLRIKIKEKKIIMMAHVSGKKGYIDSSNNLITNIDSYLLDIDFPIFTTDSEKNIKTGVMMLELITKKAGFLKKEISEIKYDEITGLSVFTSKNTHIYFGKGDYEVKIKNLKIILNDYSKKEYSPSFIDISNIRKGVVKSNL
jgi:cell division septal protein FtsQ|tara:strand:+ start:55 stop:735 length:681 start_codon:yes stop_codon:yes gene_type:complete